MPDTPDPSDADPGGATPSDPGDTDAGGANAADPVETDAGDPVATEGSPVPPGAETGGRDAPDREDEAWDADAPDREDEGEGVFGEAAPETSVEPGAPSIENTAFVLLGVASTVGLVLHLASLTG